jgi:hypothetical protein
MARYDDWMANHPEPVIETLKESGPIVEQFGELVRAFEAEHSLEELHAIIDLRPEDVAQYPLRESAKSALAPIFKLQNTLENETNISAEKLAEVKAEYKRLSRAVGMINNNTVRHT